MRVVCCFVIIATILFAAIEILNAHPLKSSDQTGFIDYMYDDQSDIVEYDQSINYDDNDDIDDKIIKANIRDILEQNKLETDLKNYKRTRHHDRKKGSPDYLNDNPYTSVHYVYHDDVKDNNSADDVETDEHVKKLFHAIENNELLELYVECAKFSKLKDQYYHNRGQNEKNRFNRQVFHEIENFCEFIKTDGDDFII